MSNPSFSIIIPSYNQGEFLADCIHSIVNSANYAKVSCQIIVVDNCSTDITPEVLKREKHHIDICITERDSGQTDAINKGILCAKGRVLNWLCCDDRLKINTLATLAHIFNKQEATEVVCGRAVYFNNNTLIGSARTSQFSPRLDIYLAFARIVQPSTFWRREAFQRLSPLDETLSYVMDLDLWLRYIIETNPEHVVFIDTVLSSVILHPECKSVKSRHKFSSELNLVRMRLVDSVTRADGSFSAFGFSHPSAALLKTSIANLTRASYLVDRSKNLNLLSPHHLIQLTCNLPSVISYLSFARPEILRIYG